MSDINIKEIMEIESGVGVDMNNDILINEERVDDNSYDVLINEERIYNNSYKNCIARMDALKKIKKSVRDNYKNIASTLSTDEKMIAIHKQAGFSDREIAEYMNISTGAVSQTYFRMRHRIRKVLARGRVAESDRRLATFE